MVVTEASTSVAASSSRAVLDVVLAGPVEGGDEDEAVADTLDVVDERPVVVGDGMVAESIGPSLRASQTVPRSPMPTRPPTRARTRSVLWEFGFGMSYEIQLATGYHPR